jgi:hypothetical protein
VEPDARAVLEDELAATVGGDPDRDRGGQMEGEAQPRDRGAHRAHPPRDRSSSRPTISNRKATMTSTIGPWVIWGWNGARNSMSGPR